MAFELPTGNLQYRTMDSAPTDGTVLMVLAGRKYPVAAYWTAAGWKAWHTGAIVPAQYWCRLPGDTFSDYAINDVSS